MDKAKAKTREGTVFRKRVESLENCFTALKIIFSPSPPVVEIQGSLLPARTVVDGDLSKYRNWTTLSGGTGNVEWNTLAGAGDLDLLFPLPLPEQQRNTLAGAGDLDGWHYSGVGDFDSDGRSDVLWAHDGGAIGSWITATDRIAVGSWLPIA